MFVKLFLKSLNYIYILCLCSTRFGRQATHLFKESTALCTLPTLLLKYDVVIINFDVTGCLFFLSNVLRPLCAPLGLPLSWSCLSCVYLYSLSTILIFFKECILFYISTTYEFYFPAKHNNIPVNSFTFHCA
jgi:hypothetical protein